MSTNTDTRKDSSTGTYYTAPDDADGIELVLILEVHTLTLEHILAEILSLTIHPCQRQSDCKVYVCGSDALTVKLMSDAHKGEQVVVIVLPLVRQILFVSLTYKILAAVIVQRVLGEGRCGIQLGNACGCDRIGGLDVAVTMVDAHDQEVVVSFHLIPSIYKCYSGSEILSLSPEPENSIYLFSGLRVVRELFVSCRKSGKKMFLTNITMIVQGLLLVIHKYINSY